MYPPCSIVIDPIAYEGRSERLLKRILNIEQGMLNVEVYSSLQNSLFNIGPARSCLLVMKTLSVIKYTAITNRQHQ
jgi:hypothetical protein